MSGDIVNINQGSHHVGIIKNQYGGPAQPTSQELTEAVDQLAQLLAGLRGQVAPGTARVIDDSLPVIVSGASAPQERHRALIAVATIAATVGALGAPTVEAANRLLGLLGAL
ncbi:hypothetical protein [Streptomyces capillispiralis]|uniref:Uncharacterized protein n=1 Tax=Streptomyces capillispiralis TaxID=68182 RepID=A0A561TI15_9ACTN|nr:hypothetical protein [Streptomyces capillispiralis]TWF86721.1 hypothetical protein FHX78_113709 [Streptomyces capillispiralis]GHH90873.1 hypothetical protein GCM10017779_13300 [Streptomyces capillispiralis]